MGSNTRFALVNALLFVVLAVSSNRVRAAETIVVSDLAETQISDKSKDSSPAPLARTSDIALSETNDNELVDDLREKTLGPDPHVVHVAPSQRERPRYSDTATGTLAVISDTSMGYSPSPNEQDSTVLVANDCRTESSLVRSASNTITNFCEDCETENCHGLETGWLLGEDPMGLEIGGWLAQSFTASGVDPRTTKFNGPVTFIDRPNEYLLNQLYCFLERETTADSRGLQVGGRVDLLYGTDARFTLARGLDDDFVSDSGSRFYKLSLPQLYAELRLRDLAVQFGRFYTIIGYETVTAPDNFFISHSYNMQYAEPFTHTGMLTRYELCDGLTFLGGLTRGWNNWEDNNDDLDFLGGVNWTSPCDETSLSVAITTGAQDDLGRNDRTVTSIVWQQEFGDGWSYVCHADIGFENNGASGNQNAQWYGVANYVMLDVNECWSFGLRQEWFSDDDGVRVAGLGSPRGINLPAVAAHWQEIALGVNYRPCNNGLIRSEARWDWTDPLVPGGPNPFDDFNRRSQFIWSIDLILGF